MIVISNNKITQGIFILVVAMFLLGQALVVQATTKDQVNYSPIEKIYSNSIDGIELFINELDLKLDADSISGDQVKFKLDTSSLLVKSTYPQLIKIKAYTKDSQANETIVQIINSSIFNIRQAKNLSFTIAIPETFSSADLWLDVYDAEGNLQASFKQYLERTNSQEASDLVKADCDYTNFGDCQLNYILNSISYQAAASKKAETVISKEASGKYTVSLPLLKVKNLKVINKAIIAGDDTGANQGDGLSSTEVINLVKAGDFSFSKLKLEKKDLAASPVPANGSLEFDGSKLYLTKNGRREELAKEGPPGAAGAAGIPGQKGDAGSFSGGDATINGTLSFAGAGKLLNPVVHNGQLINTLINNPQVSNGQLTNTLINNPQVSNGQLTNTQLINPQITDVLNLIPQDDPPIFPSTGSVYQDSSPALCIYMNGTWTKLAGTGSCASGTDNDPEPFDFTDVRTAPSTLISSNIVTITSFDNAPISISGQGVPQYSIDSGSFTASSGTIYRGQTVQIRLTSNGTAGVTHAATLTIGGISDNWGVRAEPCPDNFGFIPGSEGYDSYGNVNADYATGWCVSQYEMSPQGTALWTRDGSYGWHYQNSSGAGKAITAKGGANSFPIAQITRNEAAAACANDLLDKGGTVLTNGKLLTVYWWSKISQAIVDDGINWSGGSPGSGNLSRGNANSAGPLVGIAENSSASQPTAATFYYTGVQGRAWRMGSGEDTVYDWAGNVAEWYDDLNSAVSSMLWRSIQSGVSAYEHDNPNGSANVSILPSEFASHDTTTNGVGRMYISSTTLLSGTTYSAFYSFSWTGVNDSGVFGGYWGGTLPATSRYNYIGFRCMIPSQ